MMYRIIGEQMYVYMYMTLKIINKTHFRNEEVQKIHFFVYS